MRVEDWAHINPGSIYSGLRWVVDAVRTSFAGEFAASAMLWGSVWAAVLFVLSVWWGTATFRRENA